MKRVSMFFLSFGLSLCAVSFVFTESAKADAGHSNCYDDNPNPQIINCVTDNGCPINAPSCDVLKLTGGVTCSCQ